jgi:hypothetical protein
MAYGFLNLIPGSIAVFDSEDHAIPLGRGRYDAAPSHA